MRTVKQYENLCSVLDALLVSQLIQEFVATVVKMFFNVTNAELSTMMKKHPFLCNSCGFCKYAKFECSLTARPCCAVDPIENEEDRKKALANINSLLEKADKVYRQLIANKPELEQLLIKVSDGSDVLEESSGTGSPVNKSTHQLGQKYCVECKNSFEELNKLI